MDPLALAALVVAALVAVAALTYARVAHHRATAAEKAAQERLDELHGLRRAFITNVSHEFRTPLTSILAYAETVRDHRHRLDDERLDAMTARLAVNARRLEGLILDLLDVDGRRDAAESLVPSHVEDVDLRALLRQVAAESDVADHSLVVSCTVDTVRVDAGRLRRMLLELVDNAVRHTPPGTHVHVSASTDWSTLLLSVEDDGPGIDRELGDDLFTPFVQGPGALTGARPGLGIGLAVVRRHAEQLGGRAGVATTATGGTRVDVVLPVAVVDIRTPEPVVDVAAQR